MAITFTMRMKTTFLYLNLFIFHLDSSDKNLSKSASAELYFLSSASDLILTKSAQIHHYHMQKESANRKTELDLDALLS